MTDDQGYGVSGTFGGVIPTPALDRIANSGLRQPEAAWRCPRQRGAYPMAGFDTEVGLAFGAAKNSMRARGVVAERKQHSLQRLRQSQSAVQAVLCLRLRFAWLSNRKFGQKLSFR